MDDPDPLAAAYEPLTVAVRRLIDLTIRTEVDAAAVLDATHLVEEASDRLGTALVPGSFGVRTAPDGRVGALGNVVIGTRNPVAPPLVVHHEAEGRVWSEFVLGAQYEGPAGHVHGGICALVLDHLLGATAHQPGRPAVTGTLTLRYVRGTRLGPLRAEAWVDRVEGVKTFAVGEIGDGNGPTVHAHGVFIHPKASPPGTSD
ncbi:PaaI family thioesterase [Mycobacterium hodleri]|uniref:PaaI family thioesterase n=1 Tax=Mycolicibacterium hodleri TaxID=49897 RepID=UPI0021F30A47|nr:PaaI family thioesterase [Mycolicibacterium hodleri]MCV7136192.1 PaaI family thioesterase [Mycolicibacterium hodleri]